MLEQDIRQHVRPATELDKEVAAYLGRDELRFEVKKNGYLITRSGQPALHLSDGERTAIAFLYFLKSLSATDFDLETGIVVIDDPVSSLDANSLFSAFGFMKDRTEKAGQLFILTHNFAFFRQVRNWFYHASGKGKKDEELPNKGAARFYMLSSETVSGKRSAKLSALDPFLYQFESEYHYLFKCLYDEAEKETANSLETYYAMPNVARRLLESFLAFRLPDSSGELRTKLSKVTFDTVKKNRILRFLHTYSHADRVSEGDHDTSVLSETRDIVKDVLCLIKTNDEQHFLRMEELIKIRRAELNKP